MCARTEEWFRLRNEATLSGAIAFVPWILQQAYQEGAMANQDDIVIHRGDGAVVFSDASGFTALTERLALKSNGAELLSQCLTSFFTPLIDIILSYRGDVIKFSGDALTIYFPAVDDTQHPRYRPVVPPHGTYGLPDLGPMTTAVLRASACCIEIHKRLHMFDTGVDGVTLCLHIGVGCGSVTILQVGGVVPPEITKIKTPRYEYVIAGDPLSQISIAEPLAKNGETCVSPEAWKYVHDLVTEGRIIEGQPDFHILVQLDETKYTYPTVRNAAIERDLRGEVKFKLTELPVLRYYIPSAVFKQIEGGTLTYVNEMRNISTIFINGSGVDVSTEEGSKVAQELMSGVQRCCYAHEGTLNKYLVDDKGMLFLLVYGLPPMVHTDDPSRAVLACLDIVEIFRRLGLEGRCGVTTGRNYCGVVGSAKRMEYTVLGDTVNLAARLMANAGSLSVLVDEATKDLASREIDFRALTPIKVKGKTNLIPIFEPVPMRPRETLGFQLDSSISFPWTEESSFLGGRSKLTELSGWEEMLKLQRLLQGNSSLFTAGGVMVIGGEIGMGKTELTEYVVTEALKRFNFVPLFGTAGSRPGQKFRPIHELLRSVVQAFRHCTALPPGEQNALQELAGAIPGDIGELGRFARELQADLSLPDEVAATARFHEVGGSEEQMRFCKLGIDLSAKLVRQLCRERPVLCVLSLRSGSNIFDSKEQKEDAHMFWDLARCIADISKEQLRHPLLLALVINGGLDDVPAEIRYTVSAEGFLRMTRLRDDSILEYMGKHLQLAQSKIPDSLHRFVAKITQGNALFIRETLDQLLQYGHISIVKDGKNPPAPESMKYTPDLESINIADWANTAMVGGTICLLESLDPLQAAVVKMATVFRGVFTVADLAASSCSRWAGATYFDAFRVFSSLSVLVSRGIIDRSDNDIDVDKSFLNVAHDIDCFRLNNVLIRKVGDSMVLEAQKKAVKRQALMDRVLAKELPAKMVELRRKKAIQHIPWYYQIDAAEGKPRTI